MKKRIDFSRENRPQSYYSRVPLLHSVESVLFPIDTGYSFLLRGVMSRHNAFSGNCVESETFLPGAVDPVADTIALIGPVGVGAAAVFASTVGLPAPLVAGTVYFVRSYAGGLATLSLTHGGGLLDLTTTGGGVHTFFAAQCPDIGLSIERVSSGEGEFRDPLLPELFASPGSVGVGVFTEPTPYPKIAGGYGVNFTATPRKLARAMDSFFITGEAIQVLVSGQTIRDPVDAMQNSPSFIDIMLVGRHYPDNSLPEWAKLGGR